MPWSAISHKRSAPHFTMLAVAATIVGGMLAPASLHSQTAAAKPKSSHGGGVRYVTSTTPRRAQMYYTYLWGVDSFSVKAVESGELIRFSYKVIDADRAKPLNDKKLEPSLIAPKQGVKLVIPSLEKVGQLRQSSTPVAGKAYWMAFSNPGRVVKKGDRVNVVIGQFHADGLVVE